jgi:hypothetical protein
MSRRTTSHTLSPEQRQARLDDAHQRLTTAVEQLRTSEDWLGYLAAMRRFHNYSASNVLLITMQRPDATRVAGFGTWKSLGRSVKKGAKGIAVLAPMTRRIPVDGEGDDAPEETVTRVCGFRIVYVFDVSDTEGAPLPVPGTTTLAGDPPSDMWDALSGQLAAEGYTVELVDAIACSPGANGVTIPDRHLVQVATAGRTPAGHARTLAHELAHVLLHADHLAGATRRRIEVEAESVAYLVADGFGLGTGDYTVGYVTHWSEGNPDLVLATATTVQRCAARILAAATRDAEEPQGAVALGVS